MARPHKTVPRDRIVDAAVALAEEMGAWEAVRLHQVAEHLGLSLDDIRTHFPEKDAVIDAWFDRADEAMLRAARAEGFGEQPLKERLITLVMTWLGALAAHRRVTRQMILAKLEPGHIHIQIPALIRISRTVQWIREAAGIEHRGVRRALEETVLTGIYLAAFSRWLTDDSRDSMMTRRLLTRLLDGYLALAQCGRPRRKPAAASQAPEAGARG